MNFSLCSVTLSDYWSVLCIVRRANVANLGLILHTGLPLIIHLKIPSLFPDFSLTFYSFPYPLKNKKNIFILYFNGANCITSNLGATLERKNLLPKRANFFLQE